MYAGYGWKTSRDEITRLGGEDNIKWILGKSCAQVWTSFKFLRVQWRDFVDTVTNILVPLKRNILTSRATINFSIKRMELIFVENQN
jgi:hypothetical protein